ncbi:hypothetical protein [Clostridium botulinum]|uniref:hypothetical protein n=1 Tax=Clostridium botulinum TaxID=1491 RepID=UPI001E36D4DE|nr:hypothetical protein [Clostridium botulinum]MCD3329322.1 hypothetical protein [Clostridium botulinum D/C]MCD3344541.1 hypothetical protein [Clostridium botulinum D/C]MCD3353021.1 hypothetical protein [Clostridium botulinum D/C]
MITIGSHIRTNKEYEKKMYEPLYREKILEGLVLAIDKNGVVTYKLLKSSCDFSKRFTYHMNTWKAESIHRIGLTWLEEKN